MLQIHIISVGKLASNLSTIGNHYTKMTKWSIKYSEITYNKKLPDNLIMKYEGELIKSYLSKKSSYKIALDRTGTEYDSIKFSKIFTKSSIIEFIIGGAFGLCNELLNDCDLTLSLSKLTFPHDLAKIILLEQIYRSQTILTNHPYHK